MAFPSQSEIDIIATKILFDAQEAITRLKGWNLTVTEAQDKTKFLKELIKSTAAQMNGDFAAATASVQKFATALNVNPQLVSKIGKDLKTIDAIAKQSLGSMSEKTMESSARITLLSDAITLMAARAKMSITQVVSSLQTLNNASSNSKFGKLGFSTNDIEKAGQAARQLSGELPKVGSAAAEVGDKGQTAFQRVFTSVNALRIALGALTSMILFTVIQSIQQLAADSVKQFTEMEDSLWRIVVAEKALSQQGIEVSVSGLKKGIEDIKKLMPIFSEQDIAGLIGKISISTKELGYTQDQIIQLAKSVAILNVVSTENEDLNATATKVITALLSGTTKGVSGLGVQLNDTVIKTKAVEMGFITASESINDLTKHEKDLAKLAIVLGTGADSLGLLNDYLDTNSAKLRENSAAWDDFKTSIGGFTSSVIPGMTFFLQILTDASNMFKVILVVNDAIVGVILRLNEAIFSASNGIDAVRKSIEAIKDIPKIFNEAAARDIPKLFAKVPNNAPKWFTDTFGKYLTDVETATDATAKWKNELEDDTEIQKTLDDIDQKIQEIILDAKQAQEDLDLKMGQKKADLETEYNRKTEDAAKAHAQKLEDINTDALQKAEDAKRKSREDEVKAEQDLLQKLKELREKFLLDLEEALHNRDARQVLRLIKEYKLDKQNILDRKKLDDQQRKQTLADDLKAIEIERQRKIESENIEYKRKLDDLAIAKAREQEELQLWYKREQEDIQRNIEEKLQKLIAGYITEGKIHETEQAKIYAILAKYFKKDMALVDSLAQFMAGRFAQIGQSFSAFSGIPLTTTQKASTFDFLRHNEGATTSGATVSSAQRTSLGTFAGGLAEGGSYLATRPTTAIFGEKGAELATFTPIGRTGRDVNKLFGSLGGAGGANSTIFVNVDLSPDLEARVIQRSADNVGQVISRVNNRKVR